jgi:glycosyltransferase involved in cell wall biosynthesis
LAQFRAALLERYGLSQTTKIVVFIGRKLQYKGIETLVAAGNRLASQHDLAVFLAGPRTPWFCEFYDHLTPRERTRIIDLGAVSAEEKVNLLHLAKVLVLPSRFEAFGIVLLEAWACGIPVIGSSSGAIPSVVSNGGLIFQYGDAEDLARQIDCLFTDEGMSQTLARNGRRQVLERYTWEKIGQATRAAYRPELGRQMRILICSNLFPPHVLGGAELVAYQQAKTLQELGHDVRIFCGRLRGSLFSAYRSWIKKGEFHTTQVNLSPQDLSGDQWNFENPRVLQAFCRALDAFSPDVVHFHNLVGLSVKMIDACHARQIPTVMTLHDYWGICFKNTLIRNDGRLCPKGGFDCLGCREVIGREMPIPSPVRNAHILLSLQKIDRFIAPSHYLAERYAANGIPREWTAVIQNGVDIDRFRPTRKGHHLLTLGFIGYLGTHKGVDVLLRALRLVQASVPVHLLVVGDGEAAESLKVLCRDLHLDTAVTFYGRVENHRIAALYEEIDVLVVPSVWPENSPVTIAEAMASGIPVIASAIGGIGELVEDGVTGFLVPPGDSHTLAQRIALFLAQPELGEELGQKARGKIQAYSLSNQVNLLLSVYQNLSQQKGGDRFSDNDVLLYSAEAGWSVALRTMFQQLAEVERDLQRRLMICRGDLRDEQLFDRAKLLLIPRAGQDAMSMASHALQRRVPIIIHEGHEELRELCQASNAGLFYAEAEELRDCVTLLLSDERLRQALGDNGKRFVESFSRYAGSPVG